MERKKFIYKFSSQRDYENTKKSIRTRPYVVFIDDIDEVIFEDIIDYSKEYFTINVLENGTINLLIPKDTISYKYRINKNEWVETNEDVTLNVASNDEIEINCVCTKFENEKNNSLFNIPIPFNVYGNVMSLLFGDDFENKFSLEGRDKAFYSLFYKCSTLIDAENLILQATTLYDNCYRSMFNGCSNLIRVPELPATTLASNCYYMMFRDCTSLTEAPELYATTLSISGYTGMFYNCTSLTNAPQLPATTLANHCYDSMFSNCTSLTESPQLPATTLASNCYYMMFYKCTSLTKAQQLLATTLANHCCDSMFYNCTSLTEAPQLLATTLANHCYYMMFYNCTSLTESPQLPATTLANYCYYSMFRDCTSLIEAPQLPATKLASNCYDSMFDNTNVLPDCSNIDFSNVEVVASGGLKGLFHGTNVTYSDLEKILPKNKNGKCYLPCTTLTNGCYSSMFNGCSNLTKAPELPATTLAIDCYRYMFKNCTSLTDAPQLHATTLSSWCYATMFQGCSKLNHIEMLATDISASSCLHYWVDGVASSGTFVKHKEMTSLPKGINGIPQGWTVEDYV